MVETPLSREQVTEVPPGDALVVTPKDVPDSSVDVSAGRVVLANGTAMYVVEAQESSPFPALSGIGYRWDLLCVDVSGSAPLLKGPADDVSLKGVESGTLPDWYDPALGIPDIPVGYMPLAAILVTETSPNPVFIVESDIVDLRPFFKSAQATGGTTAYTAGTPGDWIVLPTSVGAGLDELADRLNTDVSPQEVRGSVGVPGSSKVAARADHAHYHGELGNTGTVLWNHITQQVGHARGPVNYWEGSLQESSWDRLEELARRARILENAFTVPWRASIQANRGQTDWGVFVVKDADNYSSSSGEFVITLPSSDYFLDRMTMIIRHCYTPSAALTYCGDYIVSVNKTDTTSVSLGPYSGMIHGVRVEYNEGGLSAVSDDVTHFKSKDASFTVGSTTYGNCFLYILSNSVRWDIDFKQDGADFYVRLDDSVLPWPGGLDNVVSVHIDYDFVSEL